MNILMYLGFDFNKKLYHQRKFLEFYKQSMYFNIMWFYIIWLYIPKNSKNQNLIKCLIKEWIMKLTVFGESPRI